VLAGGRGNAFEDSGDGRRTPGHRG